jgi:hypothetical protein
VQGFQIAVIRTRVANIIIQETPVSAVCLMPSLTASLPLSPMRKVWSRDRLPRFEDPFTTPSSWMQQGTKTDKMKILFFRLFSKYR